MAMPLSTLKTGNICPILRKMLIPVVHFMIYFYDICNEGTLRATNHNISNQQSTMTNTIEHHPRKNYLKSNPDEEENKSNVKKLQEINNAVRTRRAVSGSGITILYPIILYGQTYDTF